MLLRVEVERDLAVSDLMEVARPARRGWGLPRDWSKVVKGRGTRASAARKCADVRRGGAVAMRRPSLVRAPQQATRKEGPQGGLSDQHAWSNQARRAAEALKAEQALVTPPPSPPLVLSGHAASLTPY